MGAHRGLRAFTPHYLCVASAEPGIGVNPQGSTMVDMVAGSTMVDMVAGSTNLVVNEILRPGHRQRYEDQFWPLVGRYLSHGERVQSNLKLTKQPKFRCFLFWDRLAALKKAHCFL